MNTDSKMLFFHGMQTNSRYRQKPLEFVKRYVQLEGHMTVNAKLLAKIFQVSHAFFVFFITAAADQNQLDVVMSALV